MLIVEFCGTPGCGKTTLCDEVEAELRAMGYKVKNLQKPKQDYTLVGRIKKVICKYWYRYIPLNHRLKKSLKKIEPFLAKDSQINWLDRMLESSYKVKKAEAPGIEIGLFDEGCLQFITSVFHEKEIAVDAQNVIDVLVDQVYQERTLIFNCQIDNEENYLRLVKRGRPDDRFLQGNKEDTLCLLMHKQYNIERVLDMLKERENSLVVGIEEFPKKNEVLEKIICKYNELYDLKRGKKVGGV